MAFQNFYSSKVSNDIGAADVTIIVDSAPTATSGRMVLEARNSTQREVIKYTGVSGNTLTGVSRAQGGTTAKPHLKGSLIELNVTAEDLQDLYDAFTSFAASNNDWRTLTGNPITSVVAKGNRSYDITFTNSVATLLSTGMRGRSTRTVAGPTQCTNLNGTNQYYSKTSPAGMTFTTSITVSVMVKLTSYAAGGIVSRYDGTNGWNLQVNASGQVYLSGFSGGAANRREVNSYQNLPLNKWVHIAAQLDMTTGGTSATTSYIMFDGVDIPAVVVGYGTSPTAITQGGNLNVGAANSTSFLSGKVAQVAIYSAKVPQATILAAMHQTINPAATSLVSGYDFNNSINDLNTTNANNLTPNGAAVATNADSFAGQQADGTIDANKDYMTIQKVAGAVVTVQVPEGNTVPTVGGISNFSYSGVKAPFGMPTSEDKWTLETHYKVNLQSPIFGATNVWTQIAGLSTSLAVPIGAWDVGYRGELHMGTTVAGGMSGFIVMSDTAPVNANFSNDLQTRIFSGASVTNVIASSYMRKPAVHTAVANYGFYGLINTSPGGNNTWLIRGDEGEVVVFAKNNYL